MRIGIDLGGSKIEVIALDSAGITLLRQRLPTPTGDYHKTLTSINTRYEAQENLLQEKQVGLEQLDSEKEVFRVHVKKRLAAYYRTGPVGLINVMFSSESLPELLSLQEYFHNLIQYDHDAINSLRSKISRLKEAKEEHSQEKNRLLAMREQVTEEKKQLAVTQEGKKSLLKRAAADRVWRLKRCGQDCLLSSWCR